MSISVGTPLGTLLKYTNELTTFQGTLVGFKKDGCVLIQTDEETYQEHYDWLWYAPRIIRVLNTKRISILEYKDDLDNWI